MNSSSKAAEIVKKTEETSRVTFLPKTGRAMREPCEIPMTAWVSIHPLFLRSMEEKRDKGGGGGLPRRGGGWGTSLRGQRGG